MASKYLAIGAVTPWVRAGVGAVASQAMGVVAGNGERVLTALAAGIDPAEAIDQTLAVDLDAEIRQLGAVTADGRAAAFSGAGCVDWFGHITGAGFSIQGNMLAGEGVLVAMRNTFLTTSSGPLPERLIEALEAGQAAGGDRRGQQAAALVVEQVGTATWSRERVDRLCDLRVDDDPQAVGKLRRLFALWAQRQVERYP